MGCLLKKYKGYGLNIIFHLNENANFSYMKKIIILFNLLLALGMQAQKKSSGIPVDLYKCWSASYEENKETSKEKIYRNCEYAFPPSRFRQSIIFEKDGTCKVLHVGEADAHYYVDCKYVYNKKKRTINISDEKGKVKMKFKVISVNKEILKVEFEE